MKRLAFSFLAVASTTAHAEPMYISDKLVVNVYTEANQDSSKVTTLDSGDAVEVIEKVDAYAHVRLPDNREGWIKSSYLSSQVPAIVRLKELEKERGATTAPVLSTQLADELKISKEQNATLQAELAAAKLAAEQRSTPIAVPTIAPASQVHTEDKQEQRDQSAPHWMHSASWGAGFVLLGGLLGFTLGYQTLARRIRRKYGSVKIY